MTTRAQLESEREALQAPLDDLNESAWGRGSAGVPALTASIARIDAILGLDDASVYRFERALSRLERERYDDASASHTLMDEDDANDIACLRTVAELMRRS